MQTDRPSFTLLVALTMSAGALFGCDHSTSSAQDGGMALPSELLRACPGAASLSTSKAGACTEIGCAGGFRVSVLPRVSWPEGAYRFEFDVDGRSLTCTGSLPLKPCGEASLTCDGVDVHISESGCALPASAQSFSDISFDHYPGSVRVDVFRNDASVAHADYPLSYQLTQPNGAGCSPICCSASADLTVMLPASR